MDCPPDDDQWVAAKWLSYAVQWDRAREERFSEGDKLEVEISRAFASILDGDLL